MHARRASGDTPSEVHIHAAQAPNPKNIKRGKRELGREPRKIMRIGSHFLGGRLIAAPMAGVTDRPFRILCRRLGAALAVSEMVSSNPTLKDSVKTRRRLDHAGEPSPRWVQIAGSEPQEMAEAARFNADRGAQIIDINMGCPAKKVCNRAAGSALLSDESRVARILQAVVDAVSVPVTLKMRTGPEPSNRNAVRIARVAESAGIQAISVHGRTRACGFRGAAEHDTTRRIKLAVRLPVIANGDIDSPGRAGDVLATSGADGLMIGRAAQGNPWIFGQINRFLATGKALPPPPPNEVLEVLMEHLDSLYSLYGEFMGVRVARKHLGWYLKPRSGGDVLWRRVNQVESCRRQLALVREFFSDSTEVPDPAGMAA